MKTKRIIPLILILAAVAFHGCAHLRPIQYNESSHEREPKGATPLDPMYQKKSS
jgi:hypothetical protein